MGLKPSQEIAVYLVSDNSKLLKFIHHLSQDIKCLTKSSELHIIKDSQSNKRDFIKSFSGIAGDVEVYLPFEGLINFNSLREKILKDQSKVNEEIKVLNNRLQNKNFVSKAPTAIVDECKIKLKEANSKLISISKKLEILN